MDDAGDVVVEAADGGYDAINSPASYTLGANMERLTLQGTGEVAILSDGNAIGLEVTPDKPVFVDPDAYIGHKGNLSSNIVTDVNWKSFIGQTSGESYQVKFTGQGTVYIQASER